MSILILDYYIWITLLLLVYHRLAYANDAYQIED